MRIVENNKRVKIYRLFVSVSLGTAIFALSGMWIWEVWNRVPSDIRLRAGREEGIEFSVPATATILKEGKTLANIDLNRELTFYAEGEETYTMQVQLFGLIPFKETSLSVIQDTKLIPAGYPIGIYVHTQGVLVIDTGSFTDGFGEKTAPAKDLLKKGDYILKINGSPVEDKEQLIERIAQSDGEKLILEVKRENKLLNLEVMPQADQQGEYKLGNWVRDNGQGIGTMTYIDEAGNFGALGHGINDMDTAGLMDLKEGGLYKAEIVSVNKGIPGDPGEISGIIAYAEKNKLGNIILNTQKGIYGRLRKDMMDTEAEALPLALKQDIKEGPAKILCTLSTAPAYYDVEITEVNEEAQPVNRGLELEVTDEELLELTGGIIQGMSGSPIIQDGKLVGAVTHVLVNDPTRGYGIFIENMLEAAG